jgi:hypothetical protein
LLIQTASNAAHEGAAFGRRLQVAQYGRMVDTLRHIGAVPADASAMKAIVRTEAARLRDIMLSRTTQTNEPARCAVLLPILGALRQPLALIEVGASAGRCLLPDRYGYDYGRHRLEPPGPSRGFLKHRPR